jgi:hypothetical protein
MPELSSCDLRNCVAPGPVNTCRGLLFARAVLSANLSVQKVLRRLARVYCGFEDGGSEQIEDSDAKDKELYKARIAVSKAVEFKALVPNPDPKWAHDGRLPVICVGAGGQGKIHSPSAR